MERFKSDRFSECFPAFLRHFHHSFFTLSMLLMVLPFLWTSGCSPTFPPRLQADFDHESDAPAVLQEKFSLHAQGRYPVSVALVVDEDPSQEPLRELKDVWPRLMDRVKQTVQEQFPVAVQAGIMVDRVSAGTKNSLLTHVGENAHTEWVLMVLPSSQEVKGPAQFDILPEVSSINGYQVENHASIELGLLNLHSGRLVLHSQGTSYATLEKLDIPLASNRYPRVKGSGMTRWIYPPEDKALETLRMVALTEAFDQAVMKFSRKWRHEQRAARNLRSLQAGAES